MFAQLLRFGAIGAASTFVHIVVAVMMLRLANFTPLQANFAGFCCALLFSYIGHVLYTFNATLTRPEQFTRFCFVALVGLATSSSVVWVFTTKLGLGFPVAMAGVAILVPAMTYLALRLWVFAPKGQNAETSRVGWGLAAGLSVAVLVLFWGRMINHDTAWYLIATRKWLEGAALYVDLSEVNPPLNFYYTLPSIWLADLLGISDSNGEYLFKALIIFFMLRWCHVIVRRDLDFSPVRAALLLIGVTIALVSPAIDNFGQREQLMVILTLPWLFGQLASTPPPILQRMVRAGVAALGICLKPHFVIIPIVVTLARILVQRSLRPVFSAENMTLFGVGLAYVTFVAVIHPRYLTDIIPMAQLIYGAFSSSTEVLLWRVRLEVIILIVPTIAVIFTPVMRREFGLFVTAAVGGLIVYSLQGTGWNYHLIPFRSFALIACLLVVINNNRPSAAAFLAVIAAILMVWINLHRGFYHGRTALQIAAQVQDLPDVESLIVLSPHVSAGPPAAIASQAQWASRYSANWLVPGAVNKLDTTDCTAKPDLCARLTAIASLNRAHNISDIVKYQPDLVVFDLRSGYFDTAKFSWQAFMAEDPEWAGIFRRYQEVARSERFAYFQYLPDE